MKNVTKNRFWLFIYKNKPPTDARKRVIERKRVDFPAKNNKNYRELYKRLNYDHRIFKQRAISFKTMTQKKAQK